MAIEPLRPLSEQHLADLNLALEAAARFQDLIGKCQNCGLDMARQKDELGLIVQMAERLKKEFFSERV